jgi:hypothetical protein
MVRFCSYLNIRTGPLILTCSFTGGRQHLPALKEVAQHNIMIIAMGVLSGGGGKGAALRPRQSGMGADVKLQKAAFAWIKQNAGKGKYAKVDGDRVAVAGQSCGGLES